MLTLYHNPRCSKSRQALELLENSGKEFTVRKYLEEPLSSDELSSLADILSGDIAAFVRHGDDAFKQSDFTKDVLGTKEGVLEVLAEIPQVMQRPILSDSQIAHIGRPMENLDSLLN